MGIELFQPYNIGKLELKNRFIRSGTNDSTAHDSGAVTEASVAIYRTLGQGGIGLVITPHAFVSESGRAHYGQYGVHRDEMIAGLQRLAEVVHDGGSKIAMQLSHAGMNSEKKDITGTGTLTAQVASMVDWIERPQKEMTEAEIEDIIDSFALAAIRAKKAGFDAIQIHSAHGYLLSQFLSPLCNKRTDRWGGSLENRCRIHIETIRKVRKAVGPDFPILMKFGARDELENGLTLEEGVEASRLITREGIDAIEISAGVSSRGPSGANPKRKPEDPEWVLFRNRAAAIKRVVSLPVILVGGIRSLTTAQNIINSGDADLISMSRPFIREPYLLKRWKDGDTSPAKCFSCNQCFHNHVILVCGQDRHRNKTRIN